MTLESLKATPVVQSLVVDFLKHFKQAQDAYWSGDVWAAERAETLAAKTNPVMWAAIGSKANSQGDYLTALKHMTMAYEASDDPKVKAMALNDIGSIFAKMGNRVKAEECFREALRLEPRNAMTLINHGLALKWCGDFDTAWKLTEQAIRLNPRCQTAYFNRSMSLLIRGDFENGFREYECRFKNPASKLAKPDDLDPAKELPSLNHAIGKRVLVYGEQGAGDTIQMLRYAPLLKQMGIHNVWTVQRGLKAVAESMGCFDEVIEGRGNWPTHDYHLPCMSLPRVFGTRLDTIPPAPYLPKPEHAKTSDGFKVGLAWAGSADHVDDRFRSIDFHRVLPLFGVKNVSWFSFQVGPKSLDLHMWNNPLNDLSELCKSYMDTARLLCQMDLLISVDTSVVHLAGALGVPTWCMIAFCPDWRWLLNRSDSPWYPTLRLFRQPAYLDWDSVIHNVKDELEKRLL